MLVKEDPNKEDFLDNFRVITLLNTELEILVKVLAKRLVRIVDGLVEEAQIYAILGRNIQSNLHRIRLSGI